MKKILLSFLSILMVQICAFSQDDFTLYTEDFAPYNFEYKNHVTQEKKIIGIGIDIMQYISAKAGISYDTKLLDWSDSYHKTLSEKNAFLLVTGRTAQRESLFKWIGPVGKNDSSIIAKKATEVRLKSISDIEKYKLVTVKDVASEQIFINQGGKFLNARRMTTFKGAYRMLQYDRTQAIVASWSAFAFWAKTNKVSIDDYEVVKSLSTQQLYIAANLDMPDNIINTLQKHLNNIRKKDASGLSVYDQIVKRYL